MSRDAIMKFANLLNLIQMQASLGCLKVIEELKNRIFHEKKRIKTNN